jgi:hypothetical protein
MGFTPQNLPTMSLGRYQIKYIEYIKIIIHKPNDLNKVRLYQFGNRILLRTGLTGSNPTIVSYNASAVKIYNTASRLVPLRKNICKNAL